MEIIKKIMEWPVIVQGALGSALFYVVLEVGQRAVGKITAKVGKEKNVAMWFSLAAYVMVPQKRFTV